MSEKEITKKNYFQDCWLEEKTFKAWLKKAKDNTKFRCSIGNKILTLSTSGRSALINDANGNKQIELKKVTDFFKQKSLFITQPFSEHKVTNTQTSSTLSQQTLDSNIISPAVTSSEIIWALKSVMSGYSSNLAMKWQPFLGICSRTAIWQKNLNLIVQK